MTVPILNGYRYQIYSGFKKKMQFLLPMRTDMSLFKLAQREHVLLFPVKVHTNDPRWRYHQY